MRAELGVAAEPVEQMVVQHFHFPQRAVATMNLDRVVARTEFQRWTILVPAAVAQMQDVRLHRVQQGVGARLGETLAGVLGHPVARVEHQLEKIAPEITQRGQQPITGFQVECEGLIRALAMMAKQSFLFAARGDFAPVLLRRL